MIVTIDINIENARKTLVVSAGSLEEMKQIEALDDEGVKDLVIKHCKCWSISEVKND